MPRAASAATAAAVVFVVVLLAPIAIVAERSASSPGAAGIAPGDIPPVYVPVYRAAAEAFDVHWLLLAAIHDQETAFSRLRVQGASGDAVSSGWNGCGAAGPMQFGIVGIAP